jgi:hypothetical protein
MRAQHKLFQHLLSWKDQSKDSIFQSGRSVRETIPAQPYCEHDDVGGRMCHTDDVDTPAAIEEFPVYMELRCRSEAERCRLKEVRSSSMAARRLL